MPKIVISLTSYPTRINTVYQVIESLFKQQQKADEIVLWLSTLEFPDRNTDLPDSLNNLIGKNGFRIEWVNENIISHKKYYYALQDKKSITITVDDDMRYSDTMVSTLMDSYMRHPRAISARNVHVMIREKTCIAPYVLWEDNADEYIGEERMDLCAIGVGGILYPPGCAKEMWFDRNAIIKFAKNQDDLWLKYNEIIDGIPIVYTGMNGKDVVIEGSQGSKLSLKNMCGGDNDICISALSEKLLQNHIAIYQVWFENLMQVEEIKFIKRKYYSNELDNILDNRNSQDIYICGAGKYAHIMYDFIKSCGKEKYIKAFLVTKAVQNETKEADMNISSIRDLDRKKSFCVICGVGEKYKEELKKALMPYKKHKWVEMDITGIAKLLRLEQENDL